MTHWFDWPVGRAAAGRLGRLLSAPVAGFRPVRGGYTAAWRAIAVLADGRTAFVKAGGEAASAAALRAEARVYRAIAAPFMPAFLGFEDGPVPLLAIEDLSGARWPRAPWAWTPSDVAAVRATLEAVAATPVPAGLLAPIAAKWPRGARGWARVAADPAPFLGLGLASGAWLLAALPALRAAEDAAGLAGPGLLHHDVRSDNLCFAARGPVLVDWNHACLGDPAVDLAFWAPSLAAEGGPAPRELLPGAAGLAALRAGYLAAHAGLPVPAEVPTLRSLQRAQLVQALPWAVAELGLAELGLPPPARPG